MKQAEDYAKERYEKSPTKKASNSSLEDMLPSLADLEQSYDANLGTILKELREFRKDSSQKLCDIREDINKINKRMEEAEERKNTAETRIQSSEEVLAELVKLQVQTEAKLMDGRMSEYMG